jgi:hypothetical protein
MEHEELKNLISAYSLGILDETEKQVFESHIKNGCSECEPILNDHQKIVDLLAYTVPEQIPPENVKEKIISAIQKSESVKPDFKSIPPTESITTDIDFLLIQKAYQKWKYVSGGLALALILIIVVFSLYTRNLLSNISVLENQIRLNEKLVQELQIELAKKGEVLQVIQSPKIQIVDLKGLEPSKGASGKVILNPNQNKAVFYAFNLPLPPQDKDYQLWIIKENKPVDAGVFFVDEEGLGISQINDIPEGISLNAFAVTLEPKGGVPQPTGQMYLLGSLTRN